MSRSESGGTQSVRSAILSDESAVADCDTADGAGRDVVDT